MRESRILRDDSGGKGSVPGAGRLGGGRGGIAVLVKVNPCFALSRVVYFRYPSGECFKNARSEAHFRLRHRTQVIGGRLDDLFESCLKLASCNIRGTIMQLAFP